MPSRYNADRGSRTFALCSPYGTCGPFLGQKTFCNEWVILLCMARKDLGRRVDCRESFGRHKNSEATICPYATHSICYHRQPYAIRGFTTRLMERVHMVRRKNWGS